jgi:hypothetical protein
MLRRVRFAARMLSTRIFIGHGSLLACSL